MTAIGGNARHGRAFTTTHWSVVLQAQGESPAAQEALEKLCRTYWWPLYGYVRRRGYNPEEAQDLTQGFLRLVTGAAGSRRGPPGKRTAPFVFARVVKKFSGESETTRIHSETGRGQSVGSAG